MWAQQHSETEFKNYTCNVFELFFKRKLILDDKNEILKLLENCNIPTNGFDNYLDNEGKQKLDEIAVLAKKLGVFGVPTWTFDDGEIYFGQDRIDFVKEKLVEEGYANSKL